MQVPGNIKVTSADIRSSLILFIIKMPRFYQLDLQAIKLDNFAYRGEKRSLLIQLFVHFCNKAERQKPAFYSYKGNKWLMPQPASKKLCIQNKISLS